MLVFEQLADAATGTKRARTQGAKPVRLPKGATAMAAVDHQLPDKLEAQLSSTSTDASATSSVRPGPILTLTLPYPAGADVLS